MVAVSRRTARFLMLNLPLALPGNAVTFTPSLDTFLDCMTWKSSGEPGSVKI
jgi:hypothetical protein